MKIAYRREMKHNYLIIEPDDADYDSYEMRMLAANNIEGLLKFHIKQVNGQKSYYYEITSKQPLNRILQHYTMGGEELKNLIGGIARILGRLESYLLQENQILLDPEYIYVEPEHFTVFLCIVPGRQGDFPNEMTKLLQFLLGKADHQDKECVVMAYGLYQESLKENYGMADLLEIIGGKPDKKEERAVRLKEETENKTDFAVEELPEPSDFFLREEGEKEEKASERLCILPSILTFGFILVGGFAALWFCLGRNGINAYWYAPLSGACFGVLMMFKSRRESAGRTDDDGPIKEEKPTWQMTFEEEEKGEEPPEEELDTLQTELLMDTSAAGENHYLRGGVPGLEDIAISYVPYLIGKQEGLVDYVLDRQTVSRIHVRIDREGEEYRLTDLNSTNGTSVNGHQLETNETAALNPGDEVLIANFAYIFT